MVVFFVKYRHFVVEQKIILPNDLIKHKIPTLSVGIGILRRLKINLKLQK
ncbi:MAG: hypothetical protein RLZZ540_779 [Bacteroidota bacterium]